MTMSYLPSPMSNSPAPQMTEQHEVHGFIDIEHLFSMAKRQLAVVLIGAGVGLILGLLYLQTTPPIYTASAKVLIDEGLSKVVDEVSATPTNLQTESAIMSQLEILSSARLAGVVVDKLKLGENDSFLNPPTSLLDTSVASLRSFVRHLLGGPKPEPDQDSVTDARTAVRDRAVEMLQANVLAERIGRSYVISISYRSPDPVLANSITKAFADAYLADQLEANFDATERAALWLQGRLSELQKSSQAAALEAEKFRAENGLTAARGELIAEQQLSDLNSQLVLARADSARALARYEQYQAIMQSGAEGAVENAAISGDQASGTILASLKLRYLAASKREQEITGKFGENHPQAVALRKELADIRNQVFEELRQLTASTRNDYEVARSRETTLQASVSQATGENTEANQAQVRLRELEQKADALSTLYQNFLTRFGEASQQRSFPVSKVRIISEPTVPENASSPRKAVVLGLSLILGMMMGGAFGAFNEFNERFFRTSEDVRHTLGLKFLGYLPLFEAPEKNAPGKSKTLPNEDKAPALAAQKADAAARMRVSVDAPASMFAETLRSANIASDVVLQGLACKVIGIISALPGEGKSTVAANLAQLLAAAGSKTLLIDGDLRNPGLTRSIGMRSKAGLMEAVINKQPWQTVAKIDRQTKLAVVPARVRGQFGHTSELLASSGMKRFIDEGREYFEYIIVDLPPLGPVVDAKAFAPLADGFILVTEWGSTPRAMVWSLLHAEPHVARKILGVILNKVDLRKLTKYGGFGRSEQFFDKYSSYYLEKSEPQPKVAA
jgi:polysaccharide biosynthesis transport protein